MFLNFVYRHCCLSLLGAILKKKSFLTFCFFKGKTSRRKRQVVESPDESSSELSESEVKIKSNFFLFLKNFKIDFDFTIDKVYFVRFFSPCNESVDTCEVN